MCGGRVEDASSARPLERIVCDAPLVLRRILSAYTTLRDVLRSQATCRAWHGLAKDNKWVKSCVLGGGVAPDERRQLWRELADIEALEARWCKQLSAEEVAVPPRLFDGRLAFEVLATRALPQGKVAEIERDVTRTFPTHPSFKGHGGATARGDLLKVLRAVVAAEPAVGYCQGMNFVAATLLINLSSACDAFWMLLAVLDGYHFRHVFAPGVPLLPLRVFQFSGVVRARLPRLWRHLREESFSIEIFAHQCVLTLFAYSIEPDFLAYVYDVFFLLGWKAIFRIGLGLLASLESRLLSMDIEEISRFLHQCKRSYGPGGEDALDVARALGRLLKHKVSRAEVDGLQQAFRLERWELLLTRAASDGSTDEGPLPVGLQRSSSGDRFVLDANALSTENSPPWRTREAARQASCSEGSSPGLPPVAPEGGEAGPLLVPLDELRRLKGLLDNFDEETHRDITCLRVRVAEVEKELADLLKITTSLRDEVGQDELERKECIEYKRALMDAMHVAVQTSSVARDGEKRSPSGLFARPTPDAFVQQCRVKLENLESDLFERRQEWQSRADELCFVEDDLVELRDMKARSMSQLGTFIETRMRQRQEQLDESLRKALSAKPPAKPVDASVESLEATKAEIIVEAARRASV